ncbi:MAG: LytTR family transcriptional regulator [Tidjanibacter sp.]|nr:LytTR family transcriptional regulator [Tidjanibacter sp.]
MENSRKILFGGRSAIAHSLVVPLFAFVFVVLYKPFGILSLLEMASASWSFNITILLCILLGSVALMRLLLFLLRNKLSPNGFFYTVWCVCEVVVSALFVSLYVTLMLGGESGFFDVVGAVWGRLLGVCVFPYALLYLGFALYAERTKDAEGGDPASLIKFYDEYKKLRFVIASEAVVFIKSEENYVQIHYIDHAKTKKFVLRSSMRALEEQLLRHGLVRCHRSYFINPDHIKLIRKEPSGVVVAVLKEESYDAVPISRKYQEEIAHLL